MFEVKKHLINVQGGRLYLPVAARLVWFRQEHPDWGIETRPVSIDQERQVAIFEATVFNAEGRLMAKGTKMEDIRGFPDYVEKAETGAIGRALAVCGYGTQFAPDLDETRGDRPVDAPRAYGRSRYNASSASPARSGGFAAASGTATQPPANAGAAADSVEPEPGATAAPALTLAGGPAEEHQCASCGRGLTKGQELLSVRKFGEALCPDCQRARRNAVAA